MGITVKELINRKELAEVRLVAGKQGINNLVDLTNVMDSWEIHQWLSGHELILSNGLILAEHPERIASTIIDLCAAGASGLLIKLNRYITQLPDEAIRAADSCRFPLLVSNEQFHFNTINRILNKEANKLPLCAKRYGIFSDLLTKNAGTSTFLRVLSGFLGREVSYYDNFSSKTFSSKAKAAQIQNKERMGNDLSTGVIQRNVIANGNICGILTICGDEKDLAEDEVSLMTIDYAVNMLSISQQKHLPLQFQDEYWKEQFVGELLRGNSVVSDDEIIRCGRLCGYDFFVPTRIIVIKSNENQQEAVKQLEEILASSRYPREEIFSVQLDKCLVLLWNDNQHNKTCVEWCKCFYQTCRSNGLIIYMGIGEQSNNPKYFHRAYRQAQWAIKAGSCFSGPGVYDHNTMGVLNFLYTYAETEEAKAATQEILGKLMDYDTKKPSYILMPTLQTIARCGFNLTNAAEELFVHYNTLKYRYMKIEEIMGLDLSDFSNQFKVQMALSLLHLCRDKERW